MTSLREWLRERIGLITSPPEEAEQISIGEAERALYPGKEAHKGERMDTIWFPPDAVRVIEKIAERHDCSFHQAVRFMCLTYEGDKIINGDDR